MSARHRRLKGHVVAAQHQSERLATIVDTYATVIRDMQERAFDAGDAIVARDLAVTDLQAADARLDLAIRDAEAGGAAIHWSIKRRLGAA